MAEAKLRSATQRCGSKKNSRLAHFSMTSHEVTALLGGYVLDGIADTALIHKRHLAGLTDGLLHGLGRYLVAGAIRLRQVCSFSTCARL
jgi:hypothetical protein